MTKKLLPFLLIVGLLLIPKINYATHIMGGEITWECLNTGQYVFTLKVYRDCNGVGLNVNNEVIEAHNYPAAGGITQLPLSFFSVTDITPSCEGSPCSGLSQSDPDIPGAIEEYVLKTNPVTLNGIPGANGWVFTWTSGNRNAAIDNILNAQNFGITLRAKMFAYNAQNANPCFDNSPDFFQKPSSIICAGEKFTYNHSAFDNELDQLAYSWAEPIDGNACGTRPCTIGGLYLENTNPANVLFDGAQGYSSFSPFPNTSQDPLNVPAVLDANTGEITFTSYNQGEYVSVIRVTAYKCGQKVAEVYRELQTVILSGCASNDPPSIPSPFANGTFSDTVKAGDFVNFNIDIYDTLSVSNPKVDSIFVFGSGQQFGANYTDSTAGCLNPPCATLTAPLADTGVGTYSTQFKWQTSCEHLANSTPVCYATANTYLFIVRAFDDFCPAAGQAIASFSITVLADSLVDHPDIHCADVLANGDVMIDWNQTNDPDNSFKAWMIYASSSRNGPYTLIDSIFNYNQSNYIHLGAGANNQGMHYLVRAKSACHDGWTINAPDTISTLFINPTFNNTCVDVSWNTLDSPLPSGSPNFYNIYREYPIGSGFSLYKTSNTTAFCDSFSVCTDTVSYRIEMTNAGNGCLGSNSNVAGIRFQYPLPIAEAGNSINLCTGQSGLIGGAPSGPIGSQYLWFPIDSLSEINVSNPSANPLTSTTYYLSITDSNNCSAIDSVDVILQQSPTANAGADTLICKEDFPFNLNGLVTVSNNGLWLDGLGTFNPGRNALITGYTPSPAEISSGFVDLRLISNNVGICDVDTDFIRINIPPFSASINISSSPVTCNGSSSGSASVTASGSNAPYSFTWNGPSGIQSGSTINSLPAGTYSVTISNALGCDSISSVNVTEPPILSSSIGTASNISCNGSSNGFALVSPSGGTSPYTYLWSDGQNTAQASNLAAGAYSVTLSDANGCTSVSALSLTEPALLNFASTSSNPVSCNGLSDGSASVSASGGVTPYTYNWPNGSTTNQATNLSAGNYTITLSDANGCSSTRIISVSEPGVLNVNLSSLSNISCQGLSNGTATASASGGTSPYTFDWSNGQSTAVASNLSAGSYTVTLSDANGCTTTISTILTEPQVLSSALSSSTNVSCNGFTDGQAAASGSGGTRPYTFNWSNGQSGSTAMNLAAGNYSVTVLDSNACSSVSTVLITEPAVLISSFSSSIDVSCNGLSDGTATASASGGTAPYTYLWSNGQSGNLATGLSAGTVTLSITDSKGCTASSNLIISQPLTLTSALASSSDVSCNGLNDGTATASVSGGTAPYTYLWSNGQSTSQASNLFAGSYSVTVSDANSCTSISTVNINQPTILSSTISATNQVSCNGLTDGIASLTASGGTSPYTYLWSDGQSNAQATNLGAGTYSVTLSDAMGCSQISSIAITEPNILTSSLSNSTQVSCNGFNDGSALVSVAGGTAPYTYNWSNGQSASQAINLVAGNYSVTVTDSKACSSVSSFTISEPSPLLTSISNSSNVICNGQSNGTASVAASGGTAPYAYSWSNGQNTAQSNNLVAGTYSVTVTDLNGCSSVSSTTISQPQTLSNNSIIITDVSCNGYNDGSASVSPSGGTAPYTFLWSDGQSNAQAINLAAGSYQLTTSDANNCTRLSIITVTEPSELQSSINASDISCAGLQDGNATLILSGGTVPYNILWSSGNTTPSISNLDSALYTAFIQDANSCKDTVSIQIKEPAVLQLTVTSSDTICVNSSKRLLASGSGGTGNLTYTWNQNLGNNSAITVFPASRTSYAVSVTDQNGCPPAVASTTVDVRNIYNDSLAVNSSGNICLGDSSLISTNFVGAIGPFTYTWNTALSGIQDQFVKPGLSTKYLLTVSDQCNNSLTDSVTVLVSSLPPINLPDTMIVGCSPVKLSLNNNSSSNLIYTWFFGDGTSSASISPNRVYQNPGLYSIGLRVRTIEGCENEFMGSYQVQVNPSPRANFTANPTVTSIDFPTVNFFANYADANSWKWLFGDGDSSFVQEPVYNYLDTGSYVVQFSKLNQFGCTDTSYVTIRIDPSIEIRIPNVFIPNTGGSNGGRYDPNGISNAVFHPFLKYVKDYDLQIFNRWGELVFESKDVNIGWDGYYKGKLSQADVYVYKLKVKFINGKTATKIGDVTLLR